MSYFGTVERFGGGDDSWLGSRHAVDNAESGTLDASAFDAENGVVASGTPVSRSGDLLAPYSGGELAGFVIGDHSVADGDATVPVLWHGRIIVANLPVDLEAPSGRHQFTFVPAFPAGGNGGGDNGEDG